MNRSQLLAALVIISVVGVGAVAADHVAVGWEEYPDSNVDPDDMISVQADVTTNEQTEVRLKQDRSLRSDRTLDSTTVYSSGTVSLWASVEDLELDPGESADLYLEVVEVDSPVWRRSHTDDTFSWTVSINDDPPSVTDFSVDTSQREATVSVTVEEGVGDLDSVEVNWKTGSTWSFSGESAEMNSAGFTTYEYTIPESGSFDWGESVDIRVEATGEFGMNDETDTDTVYIPENSPPSVDSWSIDENDDRTVTVEATVTDAEAGVDDVDVEWKTGSTWSFSGDSTSMSHVYGDTYRATIPSGSFDWGESVDVRVEASDTEGETTTTGTDTASIPDNSPPSIDSWSRTVNDDRTITVEATVTDSEVGVDDVELNWKTGSIWSISGDSTTMSYTGGNTYEATVPSGAFDWGESVDIFVEATDDEGETTDTSTRTETVPDNSPPSVDSWSIEENEDDRTITVEATVTDAEAGIDDVDVEWKTGSTWSFSGDSITMSHTGGDTYEATIPTSDAFDWGESVDVRIEATDNAGEDHTTDTRETTVTENTPPDIHWVDVDYDGTEVTVTAEATDDETAIDAMTLNWDTGSALPWSGETVEMTATSGDEYAASFEVDDYGDTFTYGVTATDGEDAERESPDFEGEVPDGSMQVDVTNELSTEQTVTVYVDGVERTTTTVAAGATETEMLSADPGDHDVRVEYVSEERGGETVTHEEAVTVEQSDVALADFTLESGSADGELGTYITPEEGETFELEEWYDVEIEVVNTGEIIQTFEVKAAEPTGVQVVNATKQVTVDPGETETVTFEQQFYGVNTETREFTHTLHLADEDRTELDDASVSMVGPDVGTLALEFVDEDGEAVDASYELYDADRHLVRDGRGDVQLSHFAAGEYEIVATADGHHETIETFELAEDEDRTVTVTVPTDAADAEVEDVAVLDEQSAYVQGDVVTVGTDITNVGEETHTFFVGFSAGGPDGELYDNDGTTGTSVTLGPGETEQVEVDWTVESDAPDGEYDLYVATYWESDIDALATQLDLTVEESAVTVGDPDDESLSIAVDHDDPFAGSKVALTVEDPDFDVDYEWTVVDSPSEGAAELLHEQGSHTSVTTREAGTYTVRIAAESPDGGVTTEEVEIDAEERYFDMIDADAMELAERFAPVINFHPDEEFFPTRYEAYVENSQWVIEPDGPTSGSFITEVQAPVLNDLDPEYRAHSSGDNTYLDPGTMDNAELESYQEFDRYPRTVYTSVDEVTYNGEDYVAVGYWMFYVHDPKPDGAGSVSEYTAEHTGDQEKVFVLLNENGPQYVAAQQHFGGEFRPWEQTSNDDEMIEVHPSQGAHSNFLQPYASETDEDLVPAPNDHIGEHFYQEQYMPLRLRAGEGEPDLHTDIYRFDYYTDPIGDETVWSHESEARGEEDYELLLLSDRMGWADYEGAVYTYPVTSPRGTIPQQQDVWDEIDPWINEKLVPSHKQFDAEIVTPDGGDEPTLVRDDGEVKADLTLANTGPRAGEFVVTVTAEHESGTTLTGEYGAFIDTNEVVGNIMPEIEPEEADVSVPVFPADRDGAQSGEWEITIELGSYASDVRAEEDLHDERTFSYVHQSGVDADISFSEVDSGEVLPGDAVEATAVVENTGEQEHTYFVGYSAFDSNGEPHDNNGTTGQTVTLAPGDSTDVDLSWTVDEGVPEGSYDLKTVVWLESDNEDLHTPLSDDRRDGAVTVTDTDVGTLVVDAYPADASVSVDGELVGDASVAMELEAGIYDVTVDAPQYQAETVPVEVHAGETTHRTVELDPEPVEPPEADIEAVPGDVTVGEEVTLDASGASTQSDRELTYQWDLTGDGDHERSTGVPTTTWAFDEEGPQTVTVVVTDGQSSDTATVTVDVTAEEDEEPVFAVEAEPTDEEVTVGETVSVPVSIENVGNVPGTITLGLDVDGEERDHVTVELEPDESVEESLSFDATESGDTHVIVTAVSDDQLEEYEFLINVISDTANVETLEISDPTTDDPQSADAEETIMVNASLHYGGEIDADAISGETKFEARIDDMEAEVVNVERETVYCTTEAGSSCPSSVPLQLELDVPATVTGEADLTVEATVPETDEAATLTTLETTEEDAVEIEAASIPDGVLADIQPPTSQVGVGATTETDISVTNADQGIGAFTATVELENATVGEIVDIEFAGDPIDESVSYADDGTSVQVNAFGMDIESDVTNVATVTVEGGAPGESEINLTVDAMGSPDGSSYEVAATEGGQLLVVELQPVGNFENPPGDRNGDGKFRDVNGNGEVNIVDVQALFANLDDPTVNQNPAKFDYNDDGSVDVVDVQRLFVEITQDDVEHITEDDDAE